MIQGTCNSLAKMQNLNGWNFVRTGSAPISRDLPPTVSSLFGWMSARTAKSLDARGPKQAALNRFKWSCAQTMGIQDSKSRALTRRIQSSPYS